MVSLLGAETIQGWKLFKAGNYSREKTIWGNTVCNNSCLKMISYTVCPTEIVPKSGLPLLSIEYVIERV
jgi:hypothetical protein